MADTRVRGIDMTNVLAEGVPPADTSIRDLAIPRPYPNAPKPFPFDPVFAFLNPNELKLKSNGDRPDGAIVDIARRLGVDRITIYRWMESGLDDLQADVIATRLDVHPSMLWDCPRVVSSMQAPRPGNHESALAVIVSVVCGAFTL